MNVSNLVSEYPVIRLPSSIPTTSSHSIKLSMLLPKFRSCQTLSNSAEGRLEYRATCQQRRLYSRIYETKLAETSGRSRVLEDDHPDTLTSVYLASSFALAHDRMLSLKIKRSTKACVHARAQVIEISYRDTESDTGKLTAYSIPSHTAFSIVIITVQAQSSQVSHICTYVRYLLDYKHQLHLTRHVNTADAPRF